MTALFYNIMDWKKNQFGFKIYLVFLFIFLSINIFSVEDISETQINESESEEEIEIELNEDEKLLNEIDNILKKSTDKKKEESGINSMQSKNRLIPLSRRSGFIIDRSSIPETFVAVDIVGERDIGKGASRETTNNIDVREIEFGFSGFIDWFASTNVLFALHRDNHGARKGEYIFDIHEAFFELYALPWNLRARIGKMFFDAGRLNGIHRHDWFFTNAPVVHKEIFNDTFVGEGAADTGVELSYLMPWDFFQELKVGVFRGRTFGHGHGDGTEKPAPLYLARLKQFLPIIGNWGTEFGFTYFRYQTTKNIKDVDQTFGSDITVRWYLSRFYMFIFSSEIWYKNKETENAPTNSQMGFYSFFNFTFFQNYSIGYRFDWFRDKLRTLKLTRNYNGHSLWFIWRPSEFSSYRINYELKNYFEYKNLNGYNQAVYVQAVFMLGFHPPHKY